MFTSRIELDMSCLREELRKLLKAEGRAGSKDELIMDAVLSLVERALLDLNKIATAAEHIARSGY